ncbi:MULTISPECIES: hypothetical protein [unclassified Rathayibacter]|uniref:hypothetical protein n=1 Tax=unclassified Rathayibacter TaxID=2609250 RepID=UPI0006FF111A|nr:MULTISPECIES: hypothetical protein [unclassified Rathayibacter]KQQ05475.1 hypothetical protein ASF42_02530 [Rathayibacter sp. Leaf294]KQS13338.1 hypothetical protein ASG06_02540 [Rathayibacter sp. Leaf185]
MSRREDAVGEGTLLELVRAAETGSRTLESVRHRITRTHRLSASYLGLGFVGMAVLIVIRGLASFLWALSTHSATWLSGAAWLVVIAGLVAGVAVALLHRGELPRGVLAAVLVVDTVALLLEFSDFGLTDPSRSYYPSVCVGIGATLMALISFQPLSRTWGAVGLLVGLSALGMLVQALIGHRGLGLSVTTILLALAPVFVCVSLLTTLDRHVHRSLDRSIAESVVDGPGTGPGSIASSEISRVDAQVEELLGRVRTEPLDAAMGERARRLGDELRTALARSHDQTWLSIAIEESAHLSGTVSLEDDGNLAAALRPPDRARLLSVLWLLSAPSIASRTPSIALTLSSGREPRAVSLVLEAEGVRSRDLDAAIWGILSELGDYRVTAVGVRTTLRLDHTAARRPST